MIEKLPGEEENNNGESKEQRGEGRVEKGDGNEMEKDLDALNASVLLSKEDADRQNAEKQERQESKEDIDALHHQIENNPKSKIQNPELHKQKLGAANYEQMTEEEIENRANEGRRESVTTVQNMVHNSSVIPNWLKKMTN